MAIVFFSSLSSDQSSAEYLISNSEDKQHHTCCELQTHFICDIQLISTNKILGSAKDVNVVGTVHCEQHCGY